MKTKRAEHQNVTLSLPKPLLKRVKVIAAEEEKSVSQLMKEALEDRVHRRGAYERAKKHHLRLLDQGLDLGTKGQPLISRDELHDRR